MKKISFMLSFCAIVNLVGCAWLPKNTGCVEVDYNACKANGIIVTNFVDNPIFAYIYYDYSSIDNFNVSNLVVTLTYNPWVHGDTTDWMTAS